MRHVFNVDALPTVLLAKVFGFLWIILKDFVDVIHFQELADTLHVCELRFLWNRVHVQDDGSRQIHFFWTLLKLEIGSIF